MTVSEAVFLLSLLFSACGLEQEEKEEDLNPKALPFYFARSSNESSLAKFLKGLAELRNFLLANTATLCINSLELWIFH